MDRKGIKHMIGWWYNNVYPSAKIGKGTKIGSYCEIGEKVEIGAHCNIQSFAFIPKKVYIGDRVFIGPRVTFLNDKHPPSKKLSKTVVGAYASIGGGAVILPGVTIGRHAVIGAGAVVTKDVPDNEVWVGNPARALYRNNVKVIR
jgi:acetyltransferase-like isoleucine patch superfamily enzyme